MRKEEYPVLHSLSKKRAYAKSQIKHHITKTIKNSLYLDTLLNDLKAENAIFIIDQIKITVGFIQELLLKITNDLSEYNEIDK